MRFIVLAAMLALLGSAAHAQTPVALDVATVSMTPAGVARMVTNTICVTDGNDLVCDRGAYVLPGGLISATNISVTALTVNGASINADPGFIIKSMTANATAATNSALPFGNVYMGGGSGITSSGNQITLSPGSSYYMMVNTRCDVGTNDSWIADYAIYDVTGGGYVGLTGSCNANTTGYSDVGAYHIVSPAVSRTFEVRTTGQSGSPVYLQAYTSFIVYRLGGGVNTAGGGSAAAAGSNGQLQYNTGNAFDASVGLTWTNASSLLGVSGTVSTTSITVGGLTLQQIMASATTALGDRITSGTASGVVAMAGGTVSFTTGGTSGTAYLGTIGRFVGAGVSTTGAISATSIYAGASLQLASPTAVTACNSTAAGTIRYNSPTTTLELCTGSGWQPMGVGIPAGTISAFASTTCPTGWSEYTAARGRFLRGIDNGAGNDPDGTRAPGASQADMLGSHKHHTAMGFDGGQFYGWLDGSNGPIAGSRVVTGANRLRASAPAEPNENVRLALTEVNESPVSGETRPKNVAVTYCQFNGTSNGWNNPLSGGSTVAAGSTGQLQYNTGNAFDASAGLTWTNASSLLGVAGTVSTTSITVGGLTLQQIMASATTAQGDRITSGTSAVVVNSATGIVSITQLGAVASYVHPSLGYVGPGVSATGTVSSSKVATNDVKLSQVGGQCSTTDDYGRFFRNPTTGRFQLCMPRP